jgi:thioesterase domain-containing protein
VVVLRESGAADAAKAPLFCLPHVFGDSLAYRRLLTGLPPDQPLYSVEPPAPGAFAAGFDGLVEGYLSAIRAWCPDGRFVLTGHSMGATTAFAMAARLAEAGTPPAGVILVEPSVEFGWSTARGDLARRFVELRASVAERPIPPFPPGLDAAGDDEFFAALSAVMTLARIDDTLDQAELRRMWEGYAAAITALRHYEPNSRYPGRAVLIRSEVDSITTVGEWAARCAELVEIVVAGNHFSMWNEPNVAEVARAIAAHLTHQEEKP